jgi:hypothetical protein
MQVFIDKQKDVIYIKKLNLIRFAHHWNDGILGFGRRLVDPTARRDNWDVGLVEK